MDYTVHGILQARMLEWVAFPFSKWSSQPRDWTKVSYIAGRFLPAEPQEKPISLIYNSWSNFSSWLNNVLGFCLFVFSGLGLNPASYIACLFYILYSKTISLFFLMAWIFVKSQEGCSAEDPFVWIWWLFPPDWIQGKHFWEEHQVCLLSTTNLES